MNNVFEKLRRLAKAGANVIHIASYEWERVQGFALGLAEELDLDLRMWSHSAGLQALGIDGHPSPEEDGGSDPADGSVLLTGFPEDAGALSAGRPLEADRDRRGVPLRAHARAAGCFPRAVAGGTWLRFCAAEGGGPAQPLARTQEVPRIPAGMRDAMSGQSHESEPAAHRRA